MLKVSMRTAKKLIKRAATDKKRDATVKKRDATVKRGQPRFTEKIRAAALDFSIKIHFQLFQDMIFLLLNPLLLK